MGILGERATETSGSQRGWDWGGISGSGCYSLRERGTEATGGCLFVGVCYFSLTYLLCFVEKGVMIGYLGVMIDFFDITGTRNW